MQALETTGMKQFLLRFAKDEAGATAMEYAITCSLIAVVIIAAVTTLGTEVNTSLSNAGSALR